MKRVKRRPGHSPLKKFENFEQNKSNKIYVPFKAQEVDLQAPKEIEHDEEVYPEFERQIPNPFEGSKSNRCTFYKPSNEDFGQLTDLALPPDLCYQNLLQGIGNDPKPDTTRLEQKNVCEGSMVQTRSAFVEPASGLKLDENVTADLMDDTHWQTIDSISDADLFMSRLPSTAQCETSKDDKCTPLVRDNIRISKAPRVKRIAEKFTKFKKKNVEVRKLEERVVCLEYDIFDLTAADSAVPAQKMRAFFSIKMNDSKGNKGKGNIPSIPSGVKHDFNIDDGDLQKLNKKEIEIIDEQIPENRSLLEDLKRVLRRKRALENKKKQSTLDLTGLYEMAIRESPPLNHDYSNTNLLSKAELQEIKDLILKKCASSVYGINRRTVKCKESAEKNITKCVLSGSLINELMREVEKV